MQHSLMHLCCATCITQQVADCSCCCATSIAKDGLPLWVMLAAGPAPVTSLHPDHQLAQCVNSDPSSSSLRSLVCNTPDRGRLG
jgi:hypothetical protein